MITALLQTTDAVIGASLPVTTRHIIASLQEGQPVIHTGNGNFAPIANDLNGFWSYQRVRGEVSVTATVLAGDPCQALQASVPLRIVALLDRNGCEDIATSLAAALRASTKQAEAVTGAYSVDFDRVAWTFDTNKSQEFAASVTIPLTKTLLVMDVQITVRGKASCMIVCDPVDVTCAIIAQASNAKVVECLGPERVAQICEAPIEPCLPLSFSLSDTDGNVLLNGLQNNPCGVQLNLTAPDGTVTRDGQPFGTVLSGGTIDVPCGGPPCGPLVVTINGEVAAEVEEPCGETVPFIVVDRESNPVEVTLNRGSIVVDALPCAPEEPCPVEVYINDTLVKTVADPCDEPSVFFEVLNEDDAQAGAFEAPNIWRVPTAKSLCDLLGDVEPADAQTQILDCVTEATEDALREILTDRDIVATWGAYENETNAVVLPAAFQGRTYDFLSSTGTNGTITVSVNGGTSFAAPPFTVGTGGLIFRRTTITAAGTATYRE
jgi:hypothetical protein